MPRVIFNPLLNTDLELADGALIYQVGYARRLDGNGFIQRSTVLWNALNSEDLMTLEGEDLTPLQLGYRLFSTYKILNSEEQYSSTTASTCVFDGAENIVTATVGSSSVFAAAFDHNGIIIGVTRLNKKAPHNDRLIGSPNYCADAQIDLTSFDTLAAEFDVPKTKFAKIQLIATCTGFTRCAKDNSIGEQEQLLLDILDCGSIHGRTEIDLARYITQQIGLRNPKYNLTVAVQTLTGQPALLGFYNGLFAAQYVAQNIVNVFLDQCNLSSARYPQIPMSVHNHLERFLEDNGVEERPRAIIRIPGEIFRRYSLFSISPLTSPEVQLIGDGLNDSFSITTPTQLLLEQPASPQLDALSTYLGLDTPVPALTHNHSTACTDSSSEDSEWWLNM